MNVVRGFIVFSCFVLWPMTVLAQTDPAGIRGRVLDSESGDGIPGATVVLRADDVRQSADVTDTYGRYGFEEIIPGRYTLRVSSLGYRSLTDTVHVVAGRTVTIDLLVRPYRTELDELVVETSRTDAGRFMAGLESIEPEDLKRVPMPDVSYDLAGYLQTLPGVVTAGDRGGQLFIRGGTPTQNLILLDGMPIYQPFHIVGFYSAFPADIVSYTDVYAGGFGARFGGRISSVIDITTKNGNKQEVEAAASVAPFLSGVRAEIPLSKDKVSLMVSVRESIIDRLSSPLLGQSLPFRFGDRFVKFHAYLTQTSTFSFTGLHSFDTGNIAVTGNNNPLTQHRKSTWKNDAIGARYRFVPPDEAVVAEATVYYSRLQSKYRLTPEEVREADVEGLDLGINFAYLLGDSEVLFGIFGGMNSFDWDLGSNQLSESAGVSHGGGYLESHFVLNDYVRIEPGLRVESFSRGQGRYIAPRARMIVHPFGGGSRHQLSFAWGQYHQQIVGINNQQDVSDVFTIWAASPKATPVPQAEHYLAGWRSRFFPWLELTLEGYYKDLSNLSFPVFTEAVNELSEFAFVNGEARGFDAKVEVNRPKLYMSIGYSNARVDYHRPSQLARGIFRAGKSNILFLDEISFNPPHDRRHQLNAMTQFRFGSNSIGLRWQFGAGLPFTQVRGYFNGLRELEPNDKSFHTAVGEGFVAQGSLYEDRLPPYHRLDVTYEKSTVIGSATATFQAGLINVYDRANIFEYNIFSGERIDQLPLIPSAGMKIEFK